MHLFNLIACCFLYKAKDLSAPLEMEVLEQSGNEEVCNCDGRTDVDIYESEGSVASAIN
jgi:hypothetical protein